MTHGIKHRHKHLGVYPLTFGQRIYSIIIIPTIVILVPILILVWFSKTPISFTGDQLSIGSLSIALLQTLGRLVIAYTIAVFIAVPLAIISTLSPWTEKILLPIFDIIESIPTLVFFPVLILIFIQLNFLNGAAIFILTISMVWNIVFTLVGGLKIIPQDIKFVAQVFGLTRVQYIEKVLLPAIFPQFVTGSILALAQGWNIIIVAEVLHLYMPNGSETQDLFGIGSVLVHAASTGDNTVFIAAIVLMVIAIALINFFIWQKLLHYAERYRFE